MDSRHMTDGVLWQIEEFFASDAIRGCHLFRQLLNVHYRNTEKDRLMNLTDTNTFEVFKPLADNITRRIKERVMACWEEYEASYGNIYPAFRALGTSWSPSEQGKLWNCFHRYVTAADGRGSMSPGRSEVKISEDFLNKEATQIGEESVQSMVAKIITKVGDMQDIELTFYGGADFTITGFVNGKRVRVEQQTVFKMSKNWTHYCQFPARIYVEGKFTPASKFEERVAA